MKIFISGKSPQWAGARGRGAGGLAPGTQNPRQERRHRPWVPRTLPPLQPRCEALSPEGPQRFLWVPGRCPYLEQTRLLACGQSGRGCQWEGQRAWEVGSVHPPGPTSHPRQPGPDSLRPRLPALALTWRRHDLRGPGPPHCPSPALQTQAPGHLSSQPALQRAARECHTPPNTHTLCNGRRQQRGAAGPPGLPCRWATGSGPVSRPLDPRQ